MTTTMERPPLAGSDFAELSRRINAAGLLRRRPVYYAVRLGLVATALVAGWTAFFLVGASWWTLAVAAFLAVVFAQVALVAHDLAHRQVFRTNTPSARAGLVAGNLAIGMSYGYWMAKHTKHHANPNHDDLDPDVGPGVLVVEPGGGSRTRPPHPLPGLLLPPAADPARRLAEAGQHQGDPRKARSNVAASRAGCWPRTSSSTCPRCSPC